MSSQCRVLLEFKFINELHTARADLGSIDR